MSYNQNIPRATDQLSKSQGDILANFQFLNTIASGIFDAAIQGSAPVIPTGDTGLYTLAYAPTATNETFITNATGSSYPMSASVKSQSGWTFLPSGILIKWAFGATTLPNPCTITYDTAVPFTQVFVVMINPISQAATPNLFLYVLPGSVTGSNVNFQVTSTQRTTTTASSSQYYYVAIGI